MALVALTGRVAGLQTEPRRAGVLSAVFLLVAVAVCALTTSPPQATADGVLSSGTER